MLTYYRNNLIHHFINEAYVASTRLGFSNIHDMGKGVSINDLWPRVKYLKTMLQNDFIYRKTIKTEEDLENTVKFLALRGFLNYDEGTKTISIDSKNENLQYSQSFLYHLVLPLIESYWITFSYFLGYDNRNQAHD